MQIVRARVASEAGAKRVRFVEYEKRLIAARQLGGFLPIAWIGMNDAYVRHYRLGENAGYV